MKRWRSEKGVEKDGAGVVVSVPVLCVNCEELRATLSVSSEVGASWRKRRSESSSTSHHSLLPLSDREMPQKHPLPLSVLPTVSLLKLVALSSTQPTPLPHLDHLAFFALQLAVGDVEPSSLREWVRELKGTAGEHELDEVAEGIRQQVRRTTPVPARMPLTVHLQVLKLRRRGLDEAVTWIHNGSSFFPFSSPAFLPLLQRQISPKSLSPTEIKPLIAWSDEDEVNYPSLPYSPSIR
jgi:hypothetical protein